MVEISISSYEDGWSIVTGVLDGLGECFALSVFETGTTERYLKEINT